MEHTIAAPMDGVVAELLYVPGDQVVEGAELLKLCGRDPSHLRVSCRISFCCTGTEPEPWLAGLRARFAAGPG